MKHSVARVTSEHKGAYTVKNPSGEFLARITGKQMFDATKREDFPAVGDWVTITELDDEKAVIHKVLPRKTILRKKYTGKEEAQVIAANIDVAFVVESVDRDYNLNRLERYFVLAREGKVEPIVVLNKIDLISEEELKIKIDEIKERFSDVEIVLTSAVAKQGLDELERRIEKGKTYCFIGSSGVGKSSLINKLLGSNEIKTGEIGSHSGRGKHVTTTINL